MAQQYRGPDGTIYEEMPGGGYRVVSAAPAAASAPTITHLADPARAYVAPRAEADLTRTRQQIAHDAAITPLEVARARADLENARTPRPTLPTGYRFGPDGRTAERIPGLPADQNSSGSASGSSREEQRDQLLGVLDQINRAQNLVSGGWATGITGATLGHIPGSSHRDLEGALGTVGARITQDTLADMRRSSAQGASGLGGLSEQEGRMLRDALAPIASDQSDPALLDGLQRVRGQYIERLRRLGFRVDTHSPQEIANNPDLADADAARRSGIVGEAGAAPMGGGNPPTPPAPGGLSPTQLLGGTVRQAGDQSAPTTDAYSQVPDTQTRGIVDGMIRQGATAAQINARLSGMGLRGDVGQDQVTAAQRYMRSNPQYRGGFSDAKRYEQSSGMDRFGATPLGTFMAHTANLGSFGLPSLLDPQERRDMAATAVTNPRSALAGDIAGGVISSTAAELGAGAGMARFAPGLMAPAADGTATLAARSVPYVADAVTGGVTGFNAADPGNRLEGGLLGGLGGLGGGMFGRRVVAPVLGAASRPAVRGVQRLLGRTADPVPMPGADASLLATANTGPGTPLNDITGRLTQARDLGVPMALADASPSLTTLGGSVVRRSPAAAEVAMNSFAPRARGQIDRLGTAVERDLGPIGNIPQMSADLTARARTAAGPLYDTAYRAPTRATPELDATLNTPFGRQALSRARTIAANERRDPMELGFGEDASGNTLLNPRPNAAIAEHLDARAQLDEAQAAYRASRTDPNVSRDTAGQQVTAARERLRLAQAALNAAPDPTLPASVPAYTTQTLDYVKRGMDDVLEQYRNPMTNRLMLDEAGRAQNGLKNQFVQEVDRVNPAYGAARAAYAGPASARSALEAGQDAFTASPQQLGVDLAQSSAERLAQMQLGYRGALMDAANRSRYSANPFDATLGSPVARQRTTAMYGDTPGTQRLFATADAERGLAQSSNTILGNSMTAARQLADAQFGGGVADPTGLAIDAAGAVMGNPASAVQLGRRGASRFFNRRADAQAVQRADALAPTLFNTNPSAGLAALQAIVDRDQVWRSFVNNRSRRIGRVTGGMFAGSSGFPASQFLLGESSQ